MNVDAEVAALEGQRKILTRIGGWVTALFGCMIGGYVYLKGGIPELLALPLNNMGDFLAGVFAPLAFLWLVIGYRMQALELEQNSKALQQQAAEMKNAVEHAHNSALASSLNTLLSFRVDTYTRISASISQLFSIAGYDFADAWWPLYNRGETGVWFRKFNEYFLPGSDLRECMIGSLFDDRVVRLVKQIIAIDENYRKSIGIVVGGDAFLNQYEIGQISISVRKIKEFSEQFSDFFKD